MKPPSERGNKEDQSWKRKRIKKEKVNREKILLEPELKKIYITFEDGELTKSEVISQKLEVKSCPDN